MTGSDTPTATELTAVIYGAHVRYRVDTATATRRHRYGPSDVHLFLGTPGTDW
jgi:hypothetical protein